MITTFTLGALTGAVILALVVANNQFLAGKFKKWADKAEEVIEEKTGKDI